MFNLTGLISITLGSVVLDRPDQTGRFIAKDLAGGWAYQIADAAGDARARGHGVCDGGLDLTLRCALLSALARAPHCTAIRLLVDTQEAHRMLVRLASGDPRVVAAIAGRAVSIMTRPDTRVSRQVHSAADRAAASALRDREYAEWQDSPGDSSSPDAITLPAIEATRDWRSRIDTPTARPAVDGRSDAAGRRKPLAGIIRLLRGAPLGVVLAGARNSRDVSNDRAVKAWLEDLNCHIATIRGDLQDTGA